MPKNFRNCPKCGAPGLVQEYTVLSRETCPNCSYLTQRRITPIIQGGQAMLDYLVDYFLAAGDNGPALEAALQRQLAKVQRREAKRRARYNGGKPHGEEEWQ